MLSSIGDSGKLGTDLTNQRLALEFEPQGGAIILIGSTDGRRGHAERAHNPPHEPHRPKLSLSGWSLELSLVRGSSGWQSPLAGFTAARV